MRYAIVTLFFLGIVPSSEATLVTVNFEELPVGTIVTNQYANQGVTFSLQNNQYGPPTVAGPAVTGIDSTTNPGLSGKAISPGSSNLEPFNNIEISFKDSADYASFWVGDFEESLQVLLYSGGKAIYSERFTGGVPTEVNGIRYQPTKLLTFGGIGGALVFDKLVFNILEGSNPLNTLNPFGGPEYFDNFTFNVLNKNGGGGQPIPEPTSVALLLSGLGGLKAVRRFRKSPI